MQIIQIWYVFRFKEGKKKRDNLSTEMKVIDHT